MKTFNLDFYTSYNQFFILDKNYPIDPTIDAWTQEAFDDRLAIAPGWLSVGTECYGPVKGDITILNSPPQNLDLGSFDHVVEGSIEIKSGTMEIIACMSNEPDLSIDLIPSTYRVRIYSSNLDSVKGDEGDDFYKLEVWKEPFSERKVLKRKVYPGTLPIT